MPQAGARQRSLHPVPENCPPGMDELKEAPSGWMMYPHTEKFSNLESGLGFIQ